MRHEIDMDFDNGVPAGVHVVHTERAPWNQVKGANTGGVLIDTIDLLNGFHKGTIPIAGTGWDVISKHPNHVGKTRLQAFVDSAITANDPLARQVLGI